MFFIDIFHLYLGIVDPISWLVIHLGVSHFIAGAMFTAGTIGIAYVAYLSFQKVKNYIKNARQRDRATKISKIVKTKAGSKDQIGVIDLDSNGEMTGAQIYEAESLDPELAKMSNITVVRHQS
jgi:hypothetical protein